MYLNPVLVKPGRFNYFSCDGGASEADEWEYRYCCDCCGNIISVDNEDAIPYDEAGNNICPNCEDTN